MYASNEVESPIHLLHCLTPPEQGCGELFSLDKSNGKVTGVPNHRVKNTSLPLSQQLCSSLLNLSLSLFFLIVWQIKPNSEKESVLVTRAGLLCVVI